MRKGEGEGLGEGGRREGKGWEELGLRKGESEGLGEGESGEGGRREGKKWE